MPERICKTAHDYAGRPIKVGERFHVDQSDVELMLAVGFIEFDDQEKTAISSKEMVATSPEKYQTKVMTSKSKRANQRKAA